MAIYEWIEATIEETYHIEWHKYFVGNAMTAEYRYDIDGKEGKPAHDKCSHDDSHGEDCAIFTLAPYESGTSAATLSKLTLVVFDL